MREVRALPTARPGASGSGADALNAARVTSAQSGTMGHGGQMQPGTFGSSQNACRNYGGSGTLDSAQDCAACAGTGRVVEAIGGGG